MIICYQAYRHFDYRLSECDFVPLQIHYVDSKLIHVCQRSNSDVKNTLQGFYCRNFECVRKCSQGPGPGLGDPDLDAVGSGVHQCPANLGGGQQHCTKKTPYLILLPLLVKSHGLFFSGHLTLRGLVMV